MPGFFFYVNHVLIMVFIPGFTRIWCKRQNTPDAYWFPMPYAPRGFAENLRLVDIYEEDFPGAYYYQITADSDLCRPMC